MLPLTSLASTLWTLCMRFTHSHVSCVALTLPSQQATMTPVLCEVCVTPYNKTFVLANGLFRYCGTCVCSNTLKCDWHMALVFVSASVCKVGVIQVCLHVVVDIISLCHCQQRTVCVCATQSRRTAIGTCGVTEDCAVPSQQSQSFLQSGLYPKACRMLAALEVVECVGNDLDPILVNRSTPA